MDQPQSATMGIGANIAKPANPKDYQPAEIEQYDGGTDWKGIFIGFIAIVLLVGTVYFITNAYLSLKYELKYNCIPRNQQPEIISPVK